MAVLQWGLILFLGALLIHIAFWRVRKPASPLKALLLIFLTVTAAGLAALYACDRVVGLASPGTLDSPAAYLHTLLLTVSMSQAYMVSYTLLEWDSPTLTIVTRIARAGKGGVSEADLVQLADKLPFIESRIECLIREGIIIEKGGRYIVSSEPHLFYRFILSYRRLLGACASDG
jgi:hypothetical protein